MDDLIIVRGAGDLASGIIAKLHGSGFKVLAIEANEPTAVRRLVCFSEAVWEGSVKVEGIQGVYAKNTEEMADHLNNRKVVVMRDPKGQLIEALKPHIVVDAILAKRAISTKASMAPHVIGVGPGHEVGVHCDAAVESHRGHKLGRIYYSGTPEKNTGIPGAIGGYTKERVYYAKNSGIINVHKDIKSQVEIGDVIATIDGVPVKAQISGVVRGMLRHGINVSEGMKMADIDPRVEQVENCHLISDKARCIAGGVLEAVFALKGGHHV